MFAATFWETILPNYLSTLSAVAGTVIAVLAYVRAQRSAKTAETAAQADLRTRTVVAGISNGLLRQDASPGLRADAEGSDEWMSAELREWLQQGRALTEPQT